MIRRAESQDVGRIIEMAWANVEDGPYKKRIKFNEHTLRLFVGALMDDEQARVLVYEHKGTVQGVFAFTTFANYFYFAGQVVASMVVWSVTKAFRGRVSLKLKKEAEMQAKAMGAKYMVMNGPTRAFGKLLKRCNYSFLESSYISELA